MGWNNAYVALTFTHVPVVTACMSTDSRPTQKDYLPAKVAFVNGNEDGYNDHSFLKRPCILVQNDYSFFP